MLKVIVLMCLFFIISCNGQKDNKEITTAKKRINISIEKFDIERFNKNEVNGDTMSLQNDNEIKQYKTAKGYHEDIINYNLNFYMSKSFYPNGNLSEIGTKFINDGFLYGIWKYYDKNGIIIKEINNDTEFENYPWEKIQTFLDKKGIEIDSNTKILNRNDANGPFWIIIWDSKEPTKKGFMKLKYLEINAKTGFVTKEYSKIYKFK